ncbi:hypothetical protein [Micromonospora sp. WMMD998]|uniref:hypothetical protein n=1 Tax=Micromonospora sp. WMMD998 TaxID=3016092 RepID=UPI00249A34AB|nr:hypothetical protein [Micromonospora sp. WMMD998]WFE39256.1 hypothetical protein O7619_12825 [Micromonospora sp. WMMD998]
MGQLLRGLALRQSEEVERARRAMHEPGGSVDSMAVIDAAFELAVRRRFVPGADVREIASFVADVRVGFGPTIDVLAMEALIRQALGEETHVGDLSAKTVIELKCATLVAVHDVLSWSEADVDQLLAEVEALAKTKGFNPAIG